MKMDKLVNLVRKHFGDKSANWLADITGTPKPIDFSHSVPGNTAESLALLAQVVEDPGFQESLRKGIEQYKSGDGIVYESGERPVPPEILKEMFPKKEITNEDIACRAYEISQSPECGSDHDNWVRAEKELKGIKGFSFMAI